MIPPELDFIRLKQLVTIQQVLGTRGLLDRLRRQGARLVGPCPVHGGDNPNAFVLTPDLQLWRCFTRCQGGGDVIELVRRLDGVNHRDAARILAGLAGPQPAAAPRRVPNSETPAAAFRPFLRPLPLDPSCPFLQLKGITAHTAACFEAGLYHGHGFLAGYVGVRLHDPQGGPLGYAGRRLDRGEASRAGKWKFPPGLPKGRLLYNFHRIAPGLPRPLVLTECPWSVLRLAQLDIPAVGLLGNQLTAEQAALLVHVPALILLLDGDCGGRDAAPTIAARLPDRAQILALPDGCDPDDLSDAKLLEILRPFFPS